VEDGEFRPTGKALDDIINAPRLRRRAGATLLLLFCGKTNFGYKDIINASRLCRRADATPFFVVNAHILCWKAQDII
jgi:hypothetical protein